MERYNLDVLYTSLQDFKNALDTSVNGQGIIMGLSYDGVYATFIASAIYNYFYDDMVHYEGETSDEVKAIFMKRLSYDVAVKFPYWKTKYDYILKLFTPTELSLLQSSKMTSSSQEDIKSVGGVIQKSASTPTGVNQASATGDSITLGASEDAQTGDVNVKVESDGYVDKYTNYQGKTASGSKTAGIRSGEVLREGSIDELLKILEKLPASFVDEITKEVSKHFDLVYYY